MKQIVYVASAFSKEHKGGNKAGVVFVESPLSTTRKMAIAKQLGYAETVFISETLNADYKFEYFTPKEEVDLCGHATIAAFVILGHLNQRHKTNYKIETNSGILTIAIENDLIVMEQNSPLFYDRLSPIELSGCFDRQAIADTMPIQIVSTGLKDIIVPIKSEAQLNDLQPNFQKIKEVSHKHNVIGMHLFAVNEERFICRNFAPLYDINEEAATGTANGALACYLTKEWPIQKDRYVFEQGYSLNSPSEIVVRLDTDSKNKTERVYVGGKGYYCETRYLF